ncbi:hypothetical protein KQH50_03120 [bacterium]|nr:hypothetical protein [bacterium]
MWKSLISDYFRDNYLIGEYFGAEKADFGLSKPDVVTDNNTDCGLKSPPHWLSPESGLRIALTVKPISDLERSDALHISSLDFLEVGDQIYHCMESVGLELTKLLSRRQEEIQISEEMRFVNFKDRFINFPIIYFPSSNLKASLQVVNRTLQQIINQLSIITSDLNISYNISYAVDERREVLISIMGHVSEMLNWLENPLSEPPNSRGGLHDWVEELGGFLSRNYASELDNPPIFDLMKDTGVLQFERKIIQVEKFETVIDKGEEKLKYGCRDSENEHITQRLQNGAELHLGYLIIESICSKCENSYNVCECSKLLDEGVSQEVTQALPIITLS